MLFNSLSFLIFFPVVTLIYFLLPHRFRWLHLLLASCIFYCAFIPVYIFILFFTIIIDYIAGIYIEKSEGARRKRFLVMSLIANIGVLAVFKYFNFFMDNCNALIHAMHITTFEMPFLRLILPIGLSFHTFQAMSYTIEVYRGHQKAEKHFGIYSLYVMFYPQLVAGPIERPQNMLHQFHEEHSFSWDNLWSGLRLMLWGLFKKAVIADRLAVYVNAMYANPHGYHRGNVVAAAILFSFQIYGDFSGYSDIAIGSARTMGFDLMKNFDRPYLSSNIAMFWRRWHISLSTWFNDYLYMPFIIEKRDWGNVAIVGGLMMTFLVSGLWHGANWTFVFWGGLHGICMAIYYVNKPALNKMMKKAGKKWDSTFTFFGIILTFGIATLSYVFFRAATIAQAFDLLSYMVGRSHTRWFDFPTIDHGVQLGMVWFGFVVLLVAMMMVSEEVLAANDNKFTRFPIVDSMWLGVILFLVLTMGVFNSNSFIYFQF